MEIFRTFLKNKQTKIMSTLIVNLNVSPGNVDASLNPNPVTISWDASMTSKNNNPISIELNILPDSPVFFVSSDNKNVKTVFWTQDFNEGFDSYTDDLFINVTQPQPEREATKVRIDIVDSTGFKSSRNCILMYK